MKRMLSGYLWVALVVLTGLWQGCQKGTEPEIPRTRLFDSDWRFVKADPAGAEAVSFDDSHWRALDLPHDWSIEDLPLPDGDSVVGPFSKNAVGKMGTGYTVGGTAWYRKHFTIDKADEGKVVYLHFDGIYMNADIWVNGHHLGNHWHGYTSFGYPVTPFLNGAGEPNVVAVQVKNEGINARWYSGSGIYRHTWLTVVDPLHIAPWGVHVTTPEIGADKATVDVAVKLVNAAAMAQKLTYQLAIIAPDGAEVATANAETDLAAGETREINQKIEVVKPLLWSIAEPNLYQAVVKIIADNKTTDHSHTNFGIRTLQFDAENGFRLNGEVVKLKGGCFHHDNGPLGSAAIDRAEERKIEILKKAGFNAIRCSHNPPSPYLLDVCDRLGMLVIDEAFDMWEVSKLGMFAAFMPNEKNPVKVTDHSLHFSETWQGDIQSMLLRDRNHPSIIMWSIGNEIPEAADTSGFRIAKQLVDEVKKLDNTRPVTEAHVDMGAVLGGKSSWEQRAPHIEMLDVVGYNYAHTIYEADHQKYPGRVIYASESYPPLSFENWQKVESLPYIIGNFSWTAMDYIGEAGTGYPRLVDDKPEASGNPMASMMLFFNPNSWPIVLNFQGDIDLIGNPKVPYYYQHVVWREQKMAMFVHRPVPAGKKEVQSLWGFPDEMKSWNWEGHEGEKLQVHVYTRSSEVKLELDGQLIAEQKVDDSQSITATFEVPYAPGVLTARCFENGTEVASESIETVGKPAALRLLADRPEIRADRNDLAYVMVEVIDEKGRLIPDGETMVKFTLSGNGEIAAVGSGSPVDMSSFRQPQKRCWQGRCLAIVRPKGAAGKMLLTAEAEGMKIEQVEIVSR